MADDDQSIHSQQQQSIHSQQQQSIHSQNQQSIHSQKQPSTHSQQQQSIHSQQQQSTHSQVEQDSALNQNDSVIGEADVEDQLQNYAEPRIGDFISRDGSEAVSRSLASASEWTGASAEVSTQPEEDGGSGTAVDDVDEEPPETNDEDGQSALSAEDSKDAYSTTPHRSTSSQYLVAPFRSTISLDIHTVDLVDLVPTVDPEQLAAEQKLAAETKALRSELFFKHDKLCLSVNGQALEQVPEAVFELKDLQCLFIANNQLTDLPHEISNLRKIEVSE